MYNFVVVILHLLLLPAFAASYTCKAITYSKLAIPAPGMSPTSDSDSSGARSLRVRLELRCYEYTHHRSLVATWRQVEQIAGNAPKSSV
jgi:hypothetical protein